MNAWATLESLRKANARHRRGWRCREATVSDALRDLQAELAELTLRPGDLDELADVLVVAFHLAMIQGWTLAQVDQAMVAKLRSRFTSLA